MWRERARHESLEPPKEKAKEAGANWSPRVLDVSCFFPTASNKKDEMCTSSSRVNLPFLYSPNDSYDASTPLTTHTSSQTHSQSHSLVYLPKTTPSFPRRSGIDPSLQYGPPRPSYQQLPGPPSHPPPSSFLPPHQATQRTKSISHGRGTKDCSSSKQWQQQ